MAKPEKSAAEMTDPVILIGTISGAIAAIGLYDTIEAAREAVAMNDVPEGCQYSIVTPTLGTTMALEMSDD